MSPERSGSAKSLAYDASIGTLLHTAISWTDMATVTPRAVVHRRAGEWPQELANGSISLDFDHRHRRRFRLVTDQGDEILLDLPTAIAMADRDGLQLDDGTWFVVRGRRNPSSTSLIRSRISSCDSRGISATAMRRPRSGLGLFASGRTTSSKRCSAASERRR